MPVSGLGCTLWDDLSPHYIVCGALTPLQLNYNQPRVRNLM